MATDKTVSIRATHKQAEFLRILGGGTRHYSKHPKGIETLIDRYFGAVSQYTCPLTKDQLLDPELTQTEEYQALGKEDQAKTLILLDYVAYIKCQAV